jgi:hypothetical protein
MEFSHYDEYGVGRGECSQHLLSRRANLGRGKMQSSISIVNPGIFLFRPDGTVKLSSELI